MDTLYHYCPSSSFRSILASRILRLSSLTLSNDTSEGKMVSAAIARVAKRDGLSQENTRRLFLATSGLADFMGGLGFCLSEERDQLSQWRGYADDAAGIVIGFSKQYLEALAKHRKNPISMDIHLGKVEYEPDAHDSHVEPTYRKMKELIDEGAFKAGRVRTILDSRTDEEVERDRARSKELLGGIFIAAFLLFTKLYLLKSPAFREEREWRLITYHSVKSGEKKIEFRAAGDRIVPFESIEMAELDINPINEVILGPKHITPISLIEDFLSQSGYEDVAVKRSAASYR